jgi:hypothetical protein
MTLAIDTAAVSSSAPIDGCGTLISQSLDVRRGKPKQQ